MSIISNELDEQVSSCCGESGGRVGDEYNCSYCEGCQEMSDYVTLREFLTENDPQILEEYLTI